MEADRQPRAKSAALRRPRSRVRLFVLLALAPPILTAVARWSDAQLGNSVGLVESVYANVDLSGSPVTEGPVRSIDLAVFDDPGLPRRFVSVRWAGTWQVAEEGPVDIYAGADDSARVFLDDHLVIERNRELGFRTAAAPITLSRGSHKLVVEYVQLGGGMSLNVQWAPKGQQPRPFASDSMFPETPDATLVARARVGSRLGASARAAWLLLGGGVFLLGGIWTASALRRWAAAGAFNDGIARIGGAAREMLRYSRPAFWASCFVLLVWFGVARGRALDPQTLWADDVWFACLTKLDSLWSAVNVPAPVAPAFVGLLWMVRRLIPDPELSLQILPFICGLVGPLLVGLVVVRLTSSRLLALGAIALGFGAQPLAMYSVMVKPYTLDYVMSAVLLLLAIRQLGEGQNLRILAAATGLAAVLFSVPSVFLSVALVHLTALAPARPEREPSARAWRRWAPVIAFDLLLAVVYVTWLEARSNGELKAFWAGGFAPLSSLDALAGFLRTTGLTALREALPEPLKGMLVPLAGVGLVTLLVRRQWRWFGVFVAIVYAGALAASMLQIYPIGTNDRVRTMIYSHALTVTLVIVGFDGLTRWLPFRWLARLAGAAVAILVAARLASPEYPRLDHVQIVRMLEARSVSSDAIVLNTSGAYLTGYYSRWPISAYPDPSPQGFAVKIERPLTLTLERSAEEGERGLDLLDAFLERERPAHVFFFSTRRGTTAAEDVIRAHGFEEARRDTSTISTQLIEYQRIDSR